MYIKCKLDAVKSGLSFLIECCIIAVCFFLPFSLNITSVLLTCGAVLWAAKMLITLDFFTRKTPFDLLIAVLIVFSGLSIFVSPDRHFSYYNYYHSMGQYIFLYYFFINNLHSEKQIKRLIQTILFSTVVVTLYGFYQYFFGVDISGFDWVDGGKFPEIKIRVYSTLNNPNLLAGFLVVMMSIAVGLGCTAERMKTRIGFWSLIILFGMCLILTYSRGAWISILVIAIAYGIFYDRKIFWWLLALSVVVLATHHNLFDRLISILNPTDTSSTLRLALWESTLSMIMDKPFFGIGWGAYWMVYPHYDFFVNDASTQIFHAHNMYLNIAAEIGIPGLIAFLGIIYGHVKTALSILVTTHSAWNAGLMLGVIFALMGLIVNGFTDYIMFNSKISMIFWLICAVVVSVRQQQNALEN